MIFKNQSSDLEVIGDVRIYDTTIDSRDMEMITTLLSSNLYSQPLMSFIREIVSNAWDAEVEAGTTDKPVLIDIKHNYEKKRLAITIRDYGTGISPERMEEIFIKVGSSTKRDSNDYIGCFGIGRFSALAVSDMINITSYYDGVEYDYIMAKDGNRIQTMLLDSKPTDAANGVEYKVVSAIKNDTINTLKRALAAIVFFPNVYVRSTINNLLDGKSFNDIKTRDLDNFKWADMHVRDKLLLGNVLYPLNPEYLDQDNKDFMDKMAYTGLAVKFNVGEIGVTPNREQIIYSGDTVRLINSKLRAVHAELDKRARIAVAMDYADFGQYAKLITSFIYYNPLDDKIEPSKEKRWYGDRRTYELYGSYCKDGSHTIGLPVTYKGRDLCKDNSLWSSITHMPIPGLIGIHFNGKFRKADKLPYESNKLVRYDAKRILALPVGQKLTPAVKGWISYAYYDVPVIKAMGVDEFLAHVRKEWQAFMKPNALNEYILREFHAYIMSKATLFDPESKDYKTYRDMRSCNKKDSRARGVQYTIWYHDAHSYSGKKQIANSVGKLVDMVKNGKKKYILGTFKDDGNLWDEIVSKESDMAYIQAGKEARAELLKLRNVVSQDDFTRSITMTLRGCLTVNKHIWGMAQQLGWDKANCSRSYDSFMAVLKHVVDSMGWYKRWQFKWIKWLIPRSKNISPYILLAESSGLKEDEELARDIERLKHVVTNMQGYVTQISGGYLDSPVAWDLACWAALKAKVFHVSWDRYSRMRENSICRLLGLSKGDHAK